MVSYAAATLANVDGRNRPCRLAPAAVAWHDLSLTARGHSAPCSYYLWKLFGTNRPSVNLQTAVASVEPHTTGIVGNVGVGTWGTSAEFKDIKVEKLRERRFTLPDVHQRHGGLDDEKAETGPCRMGPYRQSRNTNGFSYIGDEDWSDYTFTLKARKNQRARRLSYHHVGHKGGDRYWWNIGGYGNTRHDIELNQAVLGRSVNGQVDTNKWYDIKVEVSGREIKCYMDGQLIHDVQATQPPGPLAAIAGRDEATGEIVVKVINRSPAAITAALDLTGTAGIDPNAKLISLTSPGLQDNNSLADPTKVVPVEKAISSCGAGV